MGHTIQGQNDVLNKKSKGNDAVSLAFFYVYDMLCLLALDIQFSDDCGNLLECGDA